MSWLFKDPVVIMNEIMYWLFKDPMAWLNVTIPNQTVKNDLTAKKIKLSKWIFFLKKY